VIELKDIPTNDLAFEVAGADRGEESEFIDKAPLDRLPRLENGMTQGALTGGAATMNPPLPKWLGRL